ncbi:unnamed protein product [Cunninghamella blakesleeana]
MSYISSLNLLNLESPSPITEESFSHDLALWANAQFTFDCAPGSALLEDDKKQENEKLLASLSDFNLEQQQQPSQSQQETVNTSNYLSTLLSQVQKQQQQQLPQSTINQIGLPRLAPATEQYQISSTSTPQVIDTTKLKLENINNNNKRPQDDTNQTVTPEDDKRRRNTAASARFRQKKKLREQALEQTAKDMSVKCESLEKKVRELELEAKWLRALVIEKNPSLLSDNNSNNSNNKTEESVKSTSASS